MFDMLVIMVQTIWENHFINDNNNKNNKFDHYN